jgi:hypothetical protein
MKRLMMSAVFAAGISVFFEAALADELRVDGSTPDTTGTSIHAIYAQHSHREICLLQAALINIAVGEKAKRDSAGTDPAAKAPDIGTFINGMDYDEIIAKSREYPSKVTALCRN